MRIPKSIAKYIDIVNNPAAYIRIEVDRVKDNVRHKVSDVVTKIVVFAAMGIVGLFVLIFGSVTLGLYLNDVLESSSLGFLIVTGFYVLILIVLLLIKDKERIARGMLGFAKNNVALTLKEPERFEQIPYEKNGKAEKQVAEEVIQPS